MIFQWRNGLSVWGMGSYGKTSSFNRKAIDMTECTQKTFGFQIPIRRDVVAHFNGGSIFSDAGGLLLQQVDQRAGIISRFAACFTDHGDPDLIEHTVEQLIAQWVYGSALGLQERKTPSTLLHKNLQ